MQRSKSYSITSSARASSDGGIVRPRDVGCLEVEHQLELGRLKNWQVERFGALKNLPV
jgi:hypothetical protein